MEAQGLGRGAIAVVVPFAGSREQADLLLDRLSRLLLTEGDRIIVVDNNPSRVVDATGSVIEVVHAALERSSYYARNSGVEAHADCPWVLFLDGDCRPPPDLLGSYFATSPAKCCGLVAGAVVGAPEQQSLAARYARSRGQISEGFHLRTGPYPAGVTANLLVLRAAWEAVGGFLEGVRSGADIEFCWRVQRAGWSFEHRPHATVQHLHPETVSAMGRKARRHAAGRAWINRRYPRALPRPGVIRPLVRGAGGGVVWLLRGKPERALFKLFDLVWATSMLRGYVAGDNRAERPGIDCASSEEILIASRWPVGGILGTGVVEAVARADVQDRAVMHGWLCSYLEDESIVDRALAGGWAWLRRPLRLLRVARDGRGSADPALRLDAITSAGRRVVRQGATRLVHTADSAERASLIGKLAGTAVRPASADDASRPSSSR